jgi:thiamine pyrophosphate-dependent acetolactate synthase large subunit-like protein
MIGAKIAHPDKFCMNFMGDAAFGMSGLDIETAVRSDTPITTVLMNNSTMGGYSIRYPQSIERYGAINLSGDYAKIAEGMGAVGLRVTKVDEIKSSLKKAQELNKNGKTVLIDVKTQPELKMSQY